MKKIVTLIFLLILTVVLCGCNNVKTDNTPLEGLPTKNLYFEFDTTQFSDNIFIQRNVNQFGVSTKDKAIAIVEYLKTLNLYYDDYLIRDLKTYENFDRMIESAIYDKETGKPYIGFGYYMLDDYVYVFIPDVDGTFNAAFSYRSKEKVNSEDYYNMMSEIFGDANV